MSRFRLAVRIVPRKGLLDPQGKAVSDALHTLGFERVESVHVGRYIVIEATANDALSAGESAKEMCRKLLANPVTEDFEVESAVPA